MADCFCGCGRQIKRTQWTRYGINVAGRDARKALARLDEAQTFIEQSNTFSGDPSAMVEQFIQPKREIGKQHVEMLRDVAHGDRPPFPLREFKSWLKEVRGMTGFILASPKQQNLIRRLGGG
jgi:hypothetical protein